MLGLVAALAAFAMPPLDAQGLDDLEWFDVDIEVLHAKASGELHLDPIWEGSQVRGDHRNVVALAMVDPWYGQLSVFCTGSLITSDWVLTASHCLDAVDAYEAYGFEYYALTGDNPISGDYDEVAPFRRTVMHPDYDGGGGAILHDIGLVRLDSEISAGVVVLNDGAPRDGWIGDEHNYVGYGSTYDNRGDSGVKRETWIPIDSFDGMYLYAYSPETNVCSGDSGGPSFRDTKDGLIQVGVNVFVSPGCAGGSNGSTRVDAYIDWILDKVGDDVILVSELEEGTTPGGTGTGTEGEEIGGIDRPSGNPEGFGEQWDQAVTPEQGTYPVGMACTTGGGAPAGLALFPLVLALVGGRRRTT